MKLQEGLEVEEGPRLGWIGWKSFLQRAITMIAPDWGGERAGAHHSAGGGSSLGE